MTLDRGAGMEFRTHRPSFSRETEASKEHLSAKRDYMSRGAVARVRTRPSRRANRRRGCCALFDSCRQSVT